MSASLLRPVESTDEPAQTAIRSNAAVSPYPVWFIATISVLGALYLAQVASPLRLDTDTVWYFREAMEVTGGATLVKDIFPLGYPLIIAGLERIGAPVPAGLVFVNCLFLAAGLMATWRILRSWSSSVRLATIIIALFSYPVVRSAVRPLPEAAFFGICMMAVALMTSATETGSRKRWHLAGAIVLTAIAIAFRYAGVALIPALLWSIGVEATRDSNDRTRPAITIVAGLFITIIVAVVLGWVFGRGTLAEYSRTGIANYSGHVAARVVQRAQGTLTRLGELTVNVPVGRSTLVERFAAWPGAVAALVLLLGIGFHRDRMVVTIYVATYLSMLILWPFDATRLWMPILPLLAAHICQSVHDLRYRQAARLIGYTGGACFVVTGIASIGYTTWVSYSGKDFYNRYGIRGGLSSVRQGGLNPEHDRYVRRIIARYDPARAQMLLEREPPIR